MIMKNVQILVTGAVILASVKCTHAQTTTEFQIFQTLANTEPIENATISATLTSAVNDTRPMDTIMQSMIELAPAETRVPLKYVSSSYSNGNSKGYSSKKNANDDGGYAHKSLHKEKDKDSYGYAAESAFGKTVSGEHGEEPTIKDKHSYSAIAKLGNNWKAQDEEKSAALLAEAPKETRRSEKIQSKPVKSRRGSKKFVSTVSEVDKEIARLASLVDANDAAEDNSDSEEKPVKKTTKPKHKQKSQRLVEKTATAKSLKPKSQIKRGTGRSTGYGNGFETHIFHNPKFNDRGPVLFNSKARAAKYTRTPTTSSSSHSVETDSDEIPKKKSKKNKKGKNKQDKASKKSGRLTGYDGFVGNYGSYEHDGYNADENFDGKFYGGEAVSAEAPVSNDYDGDYQENDYDEEAEGNDYDGDEATNDGEDDEEEANEGENDEEAEGNDYDYEENDYEE